VLISLIERRKLIQLTIKDEEQIIPKEKYKLILDNSNDLIAILNQDFEHEYINESAYLNILGYSKEDIIGKRVRDFTHPDDIVRSSKILKRNLIKGEILDEYRIKHKNGHYIWVETKGNFLKENGQITGAIFVSRDISERKKMEQELKESEQILRVILESTADGILVIDKDGKIIHTNSKFVNMWHIPQNLIKERDDKKLISYVLNQLKDPQAFLSRVTQLYTSTNQDFDTIYFKDGRIYERFSSPLIREGETYGRIRSFRDITKGKMAEQKLKESEEKYRKLFESSTEGIAAADMGGNLIDVNDTYLKMLGYSKEEVLGLNFRDITPKKWHEMEDNLIVKQLAEEKHSGIYEKEFIRKDGTIIPVDIRFWILKDEQGDPAIMWAIIRDITEPKRIEQELLKINKLKSEFLRRASHELKTPLISIKGFSDLILALYREDLNPDIISKMEEIDKGCERLQNIIDNLLKTSKLESPDLKPKLEKEDLTFLINYCVDELHSLMVKREHSINIEIHDSIIARFEKEEIHDVISNLLTNAIKYTPPRGWIDIKTELTDDFIIVSIKDNGIGFTEEEKGKIFKQFGKIERYGQGLDLGIDGTGLGLYISKKIVESHGGKIWMESKGKNKGSIFYFSLPLIKD